MGLVPQQRLAVVGAEDMAARGWLVVAVTACVVAASHASGVAEHDPAVEFGAACVENGWLDSFRLIEFPIVGDGVWWVHRKVADTLGWLDDDVRPSRVKVLQGRHTPNLKWAITRYGGGAFPSPDDVLLFVDNSALLYYHEVVLVSATHVAHRSHVCGSHSWTLHMADTRGVMPRSSYACRRFDAPLGVPSWRHFCGGDPEKQPRGAGNRTWSVMPTLCSPSVDQIADVLSTYIASMRTTVVPALRAAHGALVVSTWRTVDADASAGRCEAVMRGLHGILTDRHADNNTVVAYETGLWHSLAAYEQPLSPGLGSSEARGYGASAIAAAPSEADARDVPVRALARQSFAWLHAARAAARCDAVVDLVGTCADQVDFRVASPTRPLSNLGKLVSSRLQLTQATPLDSDAAAKKWYRLFRTSPKRCTRRLLDRKLHALLTSLVIDDLYDGTPPPLTLRCSSPEQFRLQVSLAAGYELLLERGCSSNQSAPVAERDRPQRRARLPDEEVEGDEAHDAVGDDSAQDSAQDVAQDSDQGSTEGSTQDSAEGSAQDSAQDVAQVQPDVDEEHGVQQGRQEL